MILVGSVIPQRVELIVAVYSDIEFIIPPCASNKRGMVIEPEVTTEPKRIYASKKLLVRCEYFEAMFNGGFSEVEGPIEYVCAVSPHSH